MEEDTTTESNQQESSGVNEINGIPIDESGNAIPDTQLDDADTDKAVDQPEGESQETPQGEVDSTDTQEENTEDNEVKSWAEKKNLPLDNPIKLAKMYREAEQKMHQATEGAKLKEVLPSQENEFNDPLVEVRNELTQMKMQNSVNDFYANNPDAREYDGKMAQLVQEDPNLAGNLKALYALARFDELNTQSDDIRRDGGREALTKLAQKQQATAIKGNAVNGQMAPSTKITSANVDQLVGQNDHAWYLKHRDEINQAMVS